MMVAGTSFRKLDTIETYLAATVVLDVKREGKNEFDKFAAALYYQSVKVGFIPKDKNEVMARLMDAGKAFHAAIEAREWEGTWLRLDVKIYIRERICLRTNRQEWFLTFCF